MSTILRYMLFFMKPTALVCFLETGLDPHAVRFTVTNLSIHAPRHQDYNHYTIIDRHRYEQPQQNRGVARIVYSAGLQPSATYIHVSVYSRFCMYTRFRECKHGREAAVRHSILASAVAQASQEAAGRRLAVAAVIASAAGKTPAGDPRCVAGCPASCASQTARDGPFDASGVIGVGGWKDGSGRSPDQVRGPVRRPIEPRRVAGSSRAQAPVPAPVRRLRGRPPPGPHRRPVAGVGGWRCHCEGPGRWPAVGGARIKSGDRCKRATAKRG
jgi:hypothetical protein